IGREAASRFRAFGCDLLYAKRERLSPDEEATLGLQHRDLDSLLRGSEVLVVCLPLSAETRGLLSAEKLGLLPEGAIVVNVARGEVMDYGALADGLRAGRLGGAGLDV